MTTSSTTLARDWLLWSLSVVYLFGFVSLFIQAPGLFGENGITPAKHYLEKEAESVEEFLSNRPTLLRLLPKIGLDVDVGIDFLCVGGVIVSFVAIISSDHRNALVSALQWIFYLSIAQVGQIFLSSKWDALLLEVGFAAIFLAPLGLFGLHDRHSSSHHGSDRSDNHRLVLWLLRWILFRLILGEGLTGLVNIFGTNYHQETTAANVQNLLHLHENQILPTPAAWLLHYLPASLIAMATGIHILLSVLFCLLILLPSKRLQKAVFYWQCFTVLIGIIFNNQGFYPILVVTISLALLRDDFFQQLQVPWKASGIKVPPVYITTMDPDGWTHDEFIGETNHPPKKPEDRGLLRSNFLRVFVASSVIICVLVCYGYPGHDDCPSDNIIVKFLVSAMHSVYGSVGFILLISLILGATSLGLECFAICKKQHNFEGLTRTKKLTNISRFACLCVVVTFLFSISLVPLTWYNGQDSGQYLPSELQNAYLWSHKHYKLVNNYVTVSKRVEINGTSVGRLELIFEGCKSEESEDWKEYSFRFKPGHVDSSPPIVAPHHPLLDEALWFASQGNYKQNHWILNLAYRLLNNQDEVLELLGDNPFPEEPPQFIKASIYEYKYSHSDEDQTSSDWFTRKWIGHYLPSLSKSHPSFMRYIKLSGLLRISDSKKSPQLQICREANVLETFLSFVRSLLGQSNGSCLCFVLILLALLLTLVDPSRKSSTSSSHHISSSYDFDINHNQERQNGDYKNAYYKQSSYKTR